MSKHYQILFAFLCLLSTSMAAAQRGPFAIENLSCIRTNSYSMHCSFRHHGQLISAKLERKKFVRSLNVTDRDSNKIPRSAQSYSGRSARGNAFVSFTYSQGLGVLIADIPFSERSISAYFSPEQLNRLWLGEKISQVASLTHPHSLLRCSSPIIPTTFGATASENTNTEDNESEQVMLTLAAELPTFEVYVVGSQALFEEFGLESTTVIQSVFSTVDQIYINQLGLNLSLTAEVFETDPFFDNPNINEALPNFNQWYQNNRPSYADAGVLFSSTNYAPASEGAVGLAFLGVACNKPSVSAAATQYITPALTKVIVAHELGHLFSAKHVNGGIMKAAVSSTLSAFSTKSINQISSHIGENPQCLEEAAFDESNCEQVPSGSITLAKYKAKKEKLIIKVSIDGGALAEGWIAHVYGAKKQSIAEDISQSAKWRFTESLTPGQVGEFTSIKLIDSSFPLSSNKAHLSILFQCANGDIELGSGVDLQNKGADKSQLQKWKKLGSQLEKAQYKLKLLD